MNDLEYTGGSYLELIKKYGFQVFSSSDGSCPCGTFEIAGIYFTIHCWRTSHNKCNCKYAGVHYKIINPDIDKKYAAKAAKLLAKQIAKAYLCTCMVKKEKYELD